MTGRVYEYRHVVGFEETNLLGNVYFANFFLWQGKCREMFLRERVPALLDAFREGFSLATRHSQCDFFAEVFAFDEVKIQMQLADLSPSTITMSFEYLRGKEGGEELLARGSQQVVCMRRGAGGAEVVDVPEILKTALRPYQKEGGVG